MTGSVILFRFILKGTSVFTVYHSNQLDLLKILISNLMIRYPLTNIFQQEVVLVQSLGMAQWLQVQLAEHCGIAANITFPLPASFIWEMFTQVFPDVPKESAFTKEAITWKLMVTLPDMLTLSSFAPLRHCLIDVHNKRKMYQLSSRIADLFDQYLVYRPEWLEIWQRGGRIHGLSEAQNWQALIWARLIEMTHALGESEWHRANLYRRFINVLNKTKNCPFDLPPRVFICGISALPPIYLEALQALSRHIDIHLMITNPCRYYWGDIQDHIFLGRPQSPGENHDYHTEEEISLHEKKLKEYYLHHTNKQQLSNPLLASWGKSGRDYLFLIDQLEEVEEVDAFIDIPTDSMLHTIQNDILDLEDHAVIGTVQEALESRITKRCLDPEDRSLSLNLCCSPQREVEVLHDQLLGMLEEDLELMPRDIIVMVADIDSYAPHIQAVFGNASNKYYLPFSISDRKIRQAHPDLQAFLSLLDLPHSRFTSEEILALLEVPALASRFSISNEGLSLLRRWVAESGVRWGLNDDKVRELDLPATGQNTWNFGLKRMLLGYSMDSNTGDWKGILPYDESSGLAAELAGNLADFITKLGLWQQRLSEIRYLEAWLPLCKELLDTFFVKNNHNELILEIIEKHWQKAINFGLSVRYSDPVPLSILRDELATYFDQARISQRFLAGKINFCTLMPMRSIPFKIVCLLGMNDGVYPRATSFPGFDLMAQKPKCGDRSRREDDRYLFLEAILSAQLRLYISLIGRSIENNRKRYPSILVSELLEYLEQSYFLPGDEHLDAEGSAHRVRQHLMQWHPRMPFAEENFLSGSQKQSYAAEWLPAASRNGIPSLNFNQPLPLLEEQTISLDALQSFYRHPIRAFFQRRLRVNFNREEKKLPNEEPFALDKLSRYDLNTRLLNALIEGESSVRLFQKIYASGELPFGAFGEIFWQKQKEDMIKLAKKVRSERDINHSLEVDIEIDGVRITGWLHHVQNDGLLRWRASKLSVVNGILMWLEHLIYCSSGGKGVSRLYERKNYSWRFEALPPDCAQKYLTELVTGYRHGQAQPLLLLNKSGWAWLNECFHTKTKRIDWTEETQIRAREKLLKAFNGDQDILGEVKDPYVRRVLRQLTVDDDNFMKILVAIERYLLPVARHNTA